MRMQNDAAMPPYSCGTCGSPVLIIEAIAGVPDRWELRCGVGHRWIPIPGTVVEVRPESRAGAQGEERRARVIYVSPALEEEER